MAYFAQLLTEKAHTLRLPKKQHHEVQRYVLQHQSSTLERAPFRRQLDFWAFCITTALAHDLTPLDQPSARWGKKFADTRSVNIGDELGDVLAIAAFHHLGYEHEEIDNPAQIIEVNNQLAGAGCPIVLDHLNDPELRLTPLDKALNFAASMVARCAGEMEAVSDRKRASTRIGDVDLPTVSDLLQSMETQRVEFKSSARVALDKDVPEKVINDGVIKTIAAFLNSRGGTLGIGIRDDGQVIGLQPDLDYKNQDVDGYQNWLTTLLVNSIGGGVIGAFVGVRIEPVDSMVVCLIDVTPSPSPIYAKTTRGKDCFYVRIGNTTRMLDGRQTVNYIIGHWPQT